MNTSTRTVRGALIAFSMLLVASAASAQQPRPIFLAVPEAFPEIDARALVVRQGSEDVVLMRQSDASAETLAMSLFVLRKVREDGLPPGEGQMIPITGYAMVGELARPRRVRLERALQRLDQRPLTDTGSFGPARWIRLATR